MQFFFFHNGKQPIENKGIKKKAYVSKAVTKRVVDINILLNKVKIEEKNEIKKKVIFYSLTIFLICLFGTLITIIE